LLRCAAYSVKTAFGILSMENYFDLIHEQLYILPGYETNKNPKWDIAINSQLLIWNVIKDMFLYIMDSYVSAKFM